MSEYAGGPSWAADPLAAYHEAADWRIRDAAIHDHLADDLECETPAERKCVSCGCTDDRGCGEDGCAWATLNPPLCTACAPALAGPHPPNPEPETTDLELDEVSPAGIALGRYVVGPMIAGAAFGLGIIGIYGLIDLVHAWLG